MSSFQTFDQEFDSPYYPIHIEDSIIGKQSKFNQLQYINPCDKDSLNYVDILDTKNINGKTGNIPSSSNNFNLSENVESNQIPVKYNNAHKRFNLPKDISDTLSQDSINSQESTDSGSFSISKDLKKEHFNVLTNKKKENHHKNDINSNDFQKSIQPIYINNSFPKVDYEKIKLFIICLLFGIITIIILNICFKIQLKFYLNKSRIQLDNF